jgi:hypothetical protein
MVSSMKLDETSDQNAETDVRVGPHSASYTASVRKQDAGLHESCHFNPRLDRRGRSYFCDPSIGALESTAVEHGTAILATLH